MCGSRRSVAGLPGNLFGLGGALVGPSQQQLWYQQHLAYQQQMQVELQAYRAHLNAAQEAQRVWEAQSPCEICGARPGREPATGVEVKDGHRAHCAFTRLRPQPTRSQLAAIRVGGTPPASGPETALEWLDRRVNEIRVKLD